MIFVNVIFIPHADPIYTENHPTKSRSVAIEFTPAVLCLFRCGECSGLALEELMVQLVVDVGCKPRNTCSHFQLENVGIGNILKRFCKRNVLLSVIFFWLVVSTHLKNISQIG